MGLLDLLAADSSRHAAYQAALGRFQRVLSVLLLMLGLVYWAIIIGVIPAGTGPFVDMATQDKVATIHFAVVNLIAAVGLWMQVAWGNVIWLYAALSAVVLHVFFPGQFGSNLLLVAFSVIAVAIFALLQAQVRRSAP